MNIRPAKPDDAAQIAEIWNAMIRDTLSTFTSIEKSVSEVADLVTSRVDAFWVADIDRSVAGFVTFGAFRSGPGYAATVEHSVLVMPCHHGMGLGRALLQTAEDAARKQGQHVIVAAISSTNHAAQMFHQRIGYDEVARMPEVGRKNGQWLDLVLMQKTL